MKKLLPFMTLLLFAGSLQTNAQSGANCFNTQFNNSADNLDMRNAYLLGYLSTMSYADYLRYMYSPVQATTSSFITSIRNDDDKFRDEFDKKLRYLFVSSTQTSLASTSTQLAINPDLVSTKSITPVIAEPAVSFEFIHKCNPVGYDPEALLISTPSSIFVVFRGTDRVACNIASTGYTWAEWMASDFKFLKRDASVLHTQIQGQVHRGMAESLLSQNFAVEMGAKIVAKLKNKITNVNKKVWLTGHSLGGAHAQLFAMYLKYHYSITAQGLYIYDAPHPGDSKFVSQLNNDIGKNKIQRFEFGDDPIPTLPPQVFFFGRAGVRNYFKDYTSTVQSGSEQIPGVDDLKILCALGNLPAEQIPQAANFQFPPACPGSACYHHPTFILEAIRHQLSASQLTGMPPPVPLPVAGDNCNQGNLTKAENNDLINNTATAIENIILNIPWAAGNLLDNLLGTGIAEGNYKLVSYAFKNNSRKYLNWNGTTNSQLRIETTGSVFTLKHKLTGGYQLFKNTGNMAADVKFSFGVPTGEEVTNNIIMKTKDDIIGDEETWYFFKVPNTTNTYVILNWNTKKVLDVLNNCQTSGSCGVDEATGVSNDATQVWILEKIN